MTPLRSVGVCAALFATAALAYVLPGSSVLRRMGDARDDLRLTSLRVNGTVAFTADTLLPAADALGVPPSGEEVRTDATFSLRIPGRCRLDLLNAGQSRQAVVFAQGRTRVEGTALPSSRVALEEVCALIAVRSNGSEGLDALYRHLRALGVDTHQTSLGRFGGQVVYVLGAPDGDAPRFEIYKDTFMPARIQFTREGQRLDVRFLDFGGPITGAWFPRIVEVYRNDALQLRFSSLRADSRATLSDKLFSATP
jgi:hypothetical protein